jgi:Na+/proline symporter
MYDRPLIDIIIVYFLIMIGIGLRSMRWIRDQEDYFLVGRRFGAFVQPLRPSDREHRRIRA